MKGWKSLQRLCIGTHSTPMKLGQCVAVALLRRWHAEQVRTIFNEAEVVLLSAEEVDDLPFLVGVGCVVPPDVYIDIGGEFDVERGRFDHNASQVEAGRSAAGLVFDSLFADDPRRPFLYPIIRYVDAVTTRPPTGPGKGSVSVSTLLSAIGRARLDDDAGMHCIDLVDRLVEYWFEQATGSARIASQRRLLT